MKYVVSSTARLMTSFLPGYRQVRPIEIRETIKSHDGPLLNSKSLAVVTYITHPISNPNVHLHVYGGE